MAKDRRRSVEAPQRGAWVVRWEAKQWDFACSIMSYYWYDAPLAHRRTSANLPWAIIRDMRQQLFNIHV
jgi:hypothetical protein